MAKLKYQKNNKSKSVSRKKVHDKIKKAPKKVTAASPNRRLPAKAGKSKAVDTPKPTKKESTKAAASKKSQKPAAKHKHIEYVAVTPKSTPISAKRQSKPVATPKSTEIKSESPSKETRAGNAKAGSQPRNTRGYAPRPLPRQVVPVKLGQIPDYKPEMPAIANKEVVRQAPSNKKEDNRNRYSDKELAEFKTLLLDKLEQAKKDYELLKNTLCHTDDHGTDDTSPTFKMLEDGSDVLTREETAQLALRQEKFIQNLQNALVRIENKTYGICRVTGKLIPKERLKRVPHATLSIDAKLEQQYNI